MAEPCSNPNRRRLLAGLGGASAALALPVPGAAAARDGFVRRNGTALTVGGKPYRFVGANLWYAAYLGAPTEYGDSARLGRELDRLAALGVTNLRVLASSELSPLKNSVRPTFRDRSAHFNEDLLRGLDRLIAEAGRRGLRLVLYLTNYWEWSGGMATYLYWTNGGRYVDMNAPAHPWPAFPDFNASFYGSREAVGLYHDYVRAVVGRRNGLTGVRYSDDPTIMSWQLANEPRPGGSDAVVAATLPAFYGWIRETARLIKRLAPRQLVSTGSEGLMGCGGRKDCVADAHAAPEVDYLTAHVWPQNWGWVDPKDLPGTAPSGAAKVADYLDRHVAIADRLGKPLVVEEFGYPRDDGFDSTSSTFRRDRFYAQVFDAVSASSRRGGPLVGSNFWAWGGESRAEHADHGFRSGDDAWLGDPPHEPQGWYSVYDSDASTAALVQNHATALAAV